MTRSLPPSQKAKNSGNFQHTNTQPPSSHPSSTTNSIHQGLMPPAALSKLLQDPEFRLLHVEPDKSIVAVIPCNSNIMELEYRCISHLWGNVEAVECAWDTKADKIRGIDYPTRFRPGKRDKLLHIMRQYGGYWWVDLLCIDQERKDKPLHLMEDIYTYCKECIAMVDCPVDVLEELSSNDLEKTTKSISKLSTSWMYNDFEEERTHYWDTNYSDDTRPAIFNGPLEYLNTQSGCSMALANATMALLESAWFKRIWTLQESVLQPVVVITHETMDFTGGVDLSLVLNLVQELRDFRCRHSYSRRKSDNNHNPILSNSGWPYDDGEYSEDEPLDDDSLADTESRASDDMYGSDDDSLDGTESMASSNVIREDWDDDVYLDDDQFKHTYHSIENIITLRNIRLRKGTDKLGIIKVITGLDRECTRPCDYFYGIAGLLGMKLEPDKDVKELFEIFMKNLVLMDENLVVEEPEWTRQEGQDWTTKKKFYSHIVVEDLKVVKKEGTEAPRTIIWVKKRHEVPADLAGDYYKKICGDIKLLPSIEHSSCGPNDSVLNTTVEEWSDKCSSEFSDEYPLEERVTAVVRDTKQLPSDAGDFTDKIDANDSVPSATDDEDYDEDSLEERNTAAVHDTKQLLKNVGDLKDELAANDSVLSTTDDENYGEYYGEYYDEDYDKDYGEYSDEDYGDYSEEDYGEYYNVFPSKERISAAVHGTEQPLSTTATLPKALHDGGPEDEIHIIARRSKETEDPMGAMISTSREVVKHVEMDMDVNGKLRRNTISDLMRHRWAENCLCKDAKCDEKCEIIVRLVPKLEYGSYIYFFRNVVILSKVFIDDKFELLDVGIGKVVDEDRGVAVDKTMCKLGVGGKVVGTVFTRCGCQRRHNETHEERQLEERSRMLRDCVDDYDGILPQRIRDNIMHHGRC